MNKYEKRRGKIEETQEIITLIDDIFFADRFKEDNDGMDFLKLLPKLYKEKYTPALNNFIVKEDGKIRSAVGLYYSDFYVCGEKLLCGGIGNVGVHPESRSKGYMKDAMNLALSDMKEKKIDFGVLGGQRQRYNYFSFEVAGDRYKFELYIKSIYHVYGFDTKTNYTVREITQTDTEILKEINVIYKNGLVFADRKDDELLDVLRSWDAKPCGIFNNDKLCGYAIIDEQSVREFKTKSKEDLLDCTLALFNYTEKEKLTFYVPVYDYEISEFLEGICETFSSFPCNNYTVFNFEKTLRAFFKVKAVYSEFCDGEIVLNINGYNGVENLEIIIKDNNISVSATDKYADVYLEHLEAVSTLFGHKTSYKKLPPNVASWFPLPLCVFDADNV